MTSRIEFRRPPLLPSGLMAKRRAPAPHASDAPSPTVLVGQVVLGALLVFMWLALVAFVPMTALALLGLAGVSAMIAFVSRRHDSGHSRDRSTSRRGAGMGAVRGTIAISSVVLLVLALVAPAGYDTALAVLGVMGLLALRLSAKPVHSLEDDDAAMSPPPAEVDPVRDDVTHTPAVHERTAVPYELARARFSASDRPTPRTWRRRERVKYPMHAIG